MDKERFQHAIALRDSGHAEESLRELTDLMASTTDAEEKASLLLNQATCLMHLGRLRDARERLSSARRIAPRTHLQLYVDFEDASLHSHEGEWDKALGAVDELRAKYRGLLMRPEHRDLYEQAQILRGAALRAQGRVQEAQGVLEECRSFTLGAGDRRYVLYNLGASYVAAGGKQGGKETLTEALQEGLEGAEAVSAHYYLGTIYFDEGAYAKALIEFEWSLAHAEEGRIPKPHIYEWLAKTAQGLGNRKDADRYGELARSG